MKIVEKVGLAVVVALAVMALGGASPASGSSTALCKVDESPCSSGNRITHLHGVNFESVLLTSVVNIECDALFLGEVLSAQSGLGNPLHLLGTATFTDCLTESGTSCTITELNGPSLITILRTGPEEVQITGEGEVLDKCGFFIHCVYNGEGIESTGEGSLQAGGNGLISVQNFPLNRVGGFFCPEVAELDSSATSLSPLYISS